MTMRTAPSDAQDCVEVPATSLQGFYVASQAAGWSNYNVPVAWRFEGELDREALYEAVDGLFRRHEALRTTFVHKGGELWQRIWPFAPAPIPTVSIRSASSMTDPVASAAVLAELDAPFEMSDRLCRATLFRAAEDDHALVLVLHHAIADAWSGMLLDAELRAALGATGPTPAPETGLQFRDFAAREQAEDDDRHAAYWRSRIAPTTLTHALGADRPETGMVLGLLADLRPIEAATARRLEQVASDARCTLTTAILAAVVAAYTPWCTDALRLGVLHANRYEPSFHGVVGPIASCLPIRVPLHDELTFAELLASVRREWSGALAHRVPSAAFARLTGVEDGASKSVSDVIVNVLPKVSQSPELAPDPDGLRVSGFGAPFEQRRWRFLAEELTELPVVMFHPAAEGRLGMVALGDPALMTRATLDAIGDHLARTFDLLTRSPQQPIRELLRGRPPVLGLDAAA